MQTLTHRPRNIDTRRAGAILYGDWGTSKAYVIGLAFALAGYSSFWLILGVCLLAILVGINYTTLCKYYPLGGGVYSSARKRSEILSLVGAFFLIADYLVTAAISALSAFYYFGVSDPILYSCIAILGIGLLNFFGPRHVGSGALVIVVIALVMLLLLAFVSLPFVKSAWMNIAPFKGGVIVYWKQFTGVIVALSGIEAIANITGIMRANVRSKNLSVSKTSTPAIIFVMIEVAFFTAFFSFVASAIPGFELSGGTVNAPHEPNVRDYFLRYIAKYFGSSVIGETFGYWFSIGISGIFGFLLLSAVNTALNGLTSLQYVMASDQELPSFFKKLNSYGVPIWSLVFATLIPVFLVLFVRDIAGLAALYAVGFVGAIATNLGATGTDFKLPLKPWERGLMLYAFVIMLAIEITLFIDKPIARHYVITLLLLGLILRGLAKEYRMREKVHKKLPIVAALDGEHQILCPVYKPGKVLDFAIEKSKKRNYPLNVLFIREQQVITEVDDVKDWHEDKEAVKVYNYVQKKGDPSLTHFYYAVTDSRANAIVRYAKKLHVKEVIVGMPRHMAILQLLRGNLLREVSKNLPSDIHLYVIP